MQKDDIIQALRLDLPELKKNFGVQSIGLFGSYSAGTNQPDSDLDFLVELSAPLSDNYFGLWNFLETRFKKKIDLARKGEHLGEKFLNTIESEIIYA